MLPGRSAIVGATSTDYDEVEATMAGALDADDDVAPEAPPTAPTGWRRPTAGRRLRSPARFDRRKLLIGGGVVAAGAVGAVLLSSVGSSDSSGGLGGTGAPAPARPAAASARAPTSLDIINWTEYIDVTEDGEEGTIDRFQDESGISVNYSETWNDNNEAYGKEFVAYLEGGNPTPWDIAVPTYWMAARLKAKDWLAPLPYNLIPNYVNLEPQYLNVTWDPGGKFNLPWQAGVTGFAYNIAETGRELASINDLFDPEFAGRIGFFTEMRDSLGLVMLGAGQRPGQPHRGHAQRGPRPDRGGHQRRPDPALHRQRLPPGHRQRELRRLHRLVGRHRPVVEPRRPVRVPRGGGHVVVRHHGHPGRRRPTASPPPSS